jgi:hypothetical protein
MRFFSNIKLYVKILTTNFVNDAITHPLIPSLMYKGGEIPTSSRWGGLNFVDIEIVVVRRCRKEFF